MIERWSKLKEDYPHFEDVIQAGIVKLEDYRDRTELTPTYVSSMRKLFVATNCRQ